uniref:Peptidase A1 domain-containing protein n=1 Tax=Haemonchus contortus TaxID=6289 RepID=A0A7I4YWF4_HAECO
MVKMKSCLIVLLAILASVLPHVYRMPIRKIESKREKLLRLGLWSTYVKEKAVDSLDGDLLPGVSQVIDYDGAEYVVEITLGTPEQKFKVIVDTGSANFYVPDTSCSGYKSKTCTISECDAGLVCKVFCPDQTCCRKANCNKKHLFNATASTTYVKLEGKWSIKYPPLDAEGLLGNDTVRLGASGSTQPIIPGTVFGRATRFSAPFIDSEIDGVLGLAFPVIAPSRITPPISRAVQLNLLDEPLFTVYLKHSSDQTDTDGGVITYGAVDTEHCGPIMAYESLTTPTHWQFKLVAATSGNFNMNVNCRARSDTASSFIGAPATEADAIAREHKATWNEHLQHYVIDCDAKPTIMLKIGKQNYTIQSENLVLQLPDGSCALALKALSGQKFGSIWTLGIPFHRQFCTIHDFAQERIGFAKSKN